jgi:hypothetical protein
LAKLGVSFDLDDLEMWEIEAYEIIESEVAKLREKDLKHGTRRRN